MHRTIGLLAAFLLCGCNTRIQQLELQRDQLLRIESAARATRVAADSGEFDPAKYDFYLLLNRSVFDTVMTSFDGMTLAVPAGDRMVDFTVSSLRMGFRPGNPEVTLVATARDRESGLEAGVDLDTRLLIERDTTQGDALFLRVVATRIVPRVSWGAFDFTRRRFVKRLLALEATKFTERLPRIELPVKSDFRIGGPASTQTVTMPTGNGSTITGTISFPRTEQSGAVAVKHILSLRNGIHLFANVEGMP